MNDLPPMGELKGFADHAAVQSDRWLFIVLLIVVLGAALAALRWMASQNSKNFATYRDDMKVMREEIAALHAERLKAAERFAEELRTIVRTQNDDARAILRDHAEILARNAEAMGGVNQALRELQSSCAVARGAWAVPRPAPVHAPLLPGSSA